VIGDAVDADLIEVQANGVQPLQEAEQYRYVTTVADNQTSFLIVTGVKPVEHCPEQWADPFGDANLIPWVRHGRCARFRSTPPAASRAGLRRSVGARQTT
jgi:hypothetical protein